MGDVRFVLVLKNLVKSLQFDSVLRFVEVEENRFHQHLVLQQLLVHHAARLHREQIEQLVDQMQRVLEHSDLFGFDVAEIISIVVAQDVLDELLVDEVVEAALQNFNQLGE